MDPAPDPAPGVLLDIDGTLLDTNHLHVLAWWRSLRARDMTFPMERIHRLIGMGGDKLVPELVGHPVEGAADGWEEEFERFLPEVTALPGAREFVEGLADSGFQVVLASSAPGRFVEHFREVLDVERWLTGVTTADDADESKPEADIFEVAMDRYGLDRATTIAVGDTVWDARAAGKAGIRFIGVESGGTEAERLRAEGAGAVFRDLAEATGRVER